LEREAFYARPAAANRKMEVKCAGLSAKAACAGRGMVSEC